MSMSEAMGPIARGALFAALAKAQAKIRTASKDSRNPHFNSKYADLASVAEACREALTENGICVLQDPSTEGNQVRCVTTLGHASGESYESKPLAMVPKDLSPQSVGSCVTYLRRYQLASVVGVAPDDDDGNAAQNGGGFPKGNAGSGKATAPRVNTAKEEAKADGPKDHAPTTGTNAPVATAPIASAPGPSTTPATPTTGGAKDYLPANKVPAKPGDMAIHSSQAARINALREQCLDEQTFRLTWLGAYKTHAGVKCAAVTDLTFDQAANLIKRLTAHSLRQGQRMERAEAETAANVAAIGGGSRGAAPSLQDVISQHMGDDRDARDWLHGTFGVEHVQELRAEQVATAFALLSKFGTDAYDELETKARALGHIR